MLAMTGKPIRKWPSFFWEVILASFVVVLCVAVFLQVLFRYALKISFPAIEEIVSISFIYTIFLGAAVGMKRREHLEIDVILKRVPAGFKKTMNLIVVCGIAVFLGYVVKEGIVFVFDSYGQTTTYLNMPISYSYAAIPGSAIIMLYYILRYSIALLLSKKQEGLMPSKDTH
jgi:TRAP-type C4-dicarboxylate transport system permease small subunit